MVKCRRVDCKFTINGHLFVSIAEQQDIGGEKFVGTYIKI